MISTERQQTTSVCRPRILSLQHSLAALVLTAGESFLPHDAMLAWYMLTTCACLSATIRFTTETAKQKITRSMPHDSSGTLVSDAKDVGEI